MTVFVRGLSETNLFIHLQKSSLKFKTGNKAQSGTDNLLTGWNYGVLLLLLLYIVVNI